MTTVNGLPAHVLLVHAVVVLVPLTAVLLVMVAAWPAARRRLVPLTTVLALLAVVSVPLTTEAGEWLEHRLPLSPAIETHAHLGDGLLPWVVGLLVVAAAFGIRGLVERRRGETSRTGGAAVSVLLLVLAVTVGIGSVATVYRIGDSGARAAWTGEFSPTPVPRTPVAPGSGR